MFFKGNIMLRVKPCHHFFLPLIRHFIVKKNVSGEKKNLTWGEQTMCLLFVQINTNQPEWKLKTLITSVIFYDSGNVFFSTIIETPNVKILKHSLKNKFQSLHISYV